ncbi:TPA: VENN motif pre-toxin domain-containing protein, partial [Kluyvera cryocrescens]|nr:VENN motif pre-toxin domain-containing protein [Kluyvera cryocrescens]
SAPYLANEIAKNISKSNQSGRLAAHAIANVALALVKGENALSQAAGAVTAEAIGMLSGEIYGKDVSHLTEDEKTTLSAFASLAAGLAGGLAGGSTQDALSATQSLTFDKELSECRKSGGDCQSVIDKWKQISDKQSAETEQKLKDNPLEVQVVDKESAQGGYEMAERPGWLAGIGADVMSSEEAKAYVQQWNGQDLAKIDQNSPEWTKYAAFVSEPENQAALASLGILGKDLVLIAKNSFTTKSLLKEMTTQGIKFTPENIVSAAKDNSGKIIFLDF